MMPLRQRVFGRGLVERDADVAHLSRRARCRCGCSISSKLMFSSCSPISALAAGVKIGSGSLSALLQARRQLHAADRAVCLVFLPAAAGEVAAHHRLDRHRLQALDQHRAAAHLRALRRARPRSPARSPVRWFGHDVRRACANQNSAICVSTSPLPGIGSPMIDVEGRQAVARDHQDAVVADGVVVAHLAAREQRQRSAMDGCGRAAVMATDAREAAKPAMAAAPPAANEPAAQAASLETQFTSRSAPARPWRSAAAILSAASALILPAWPSQPNCDVALLADLLGRFARRLQVVARVELRRGSRPGTCGSRRSSPGGCRCRC